MTSTFFLFLHFLLLGTHTKLTPTILLIIKTILAQQFIATLLQSTFTPVLRPKTNARRRLLGSPPRLFYLVEPFPARSGKRRSNRIETAPLRLLCRSNQTHSEARQASVAPLRFILQSAHSPSPHLVIIVAINPIDAQRLRMPLALTFSDFILLTRPNIRIIIIDSGFNAMVHHPLHDSRRAWSTTSMEQHALHTLRHNNSFFRLFLHTN